MFARFAEWALAPVFAVAERRFAEMQRPEQAGATLARHGAAQSRFLINAVARELRASLGLPESDALMGNYFLKNAEITKVCAYIKDDAYIAQYYGISQQRVRLCRADLPKPERRAGRDEDSAIDGNNARIAFAEGAREGSANLAKAVNDLVKRTERALCIPPEFQHQRNEFARAYLGIAA